MGNKNKRKQRQRLKERILAYELIRKPKSKKGNSGYHKPGSLQ